jgi:hypothetical protein
MFRVLNAGVYVLGIGLVQFDVGGVWPILLLVATGSGSVFMMLQDRTARGINAPTTLKL